jgi:dihydropteroate synthase
LDAGIKEARIVIDPGSVSSGTEHPWYERDAEVLANLGLMRELRRPSMSAFSRKSLIAKLTGAEVPSDSLGGSLAAAVLAVATAHPW